LVTKEGGGKMSKKVINLGKVKGRTLDLKVEDNIIKKKYDDEAEWEDLVEVPDAGVSVVDTVNDLPTDAKEDSVAFVKNEAFVERVEQTEEISLDIKGGDQILDIELKQDAVYLSDADFTEKYPELANEDIAGIRIICQFVEDIDKVANLLNSRDDITVVHSKDYVKNMKPSGYRSYHMIISVPVYFSDRIKDVKVEIQIRTVAMDFWASLEHKINYKFEGNAPQHIKEELIECSEMIANLDAKMLSLNEEILEIEAKQKEEKMKKSGQ
jgi:putative GTP pyrophosphokinase